MAACENVAARRRPAAACITGTWTLKAEKLSLLLGKHPFHLDQLTNPSSGTGRRSSVDSVSTDSYSSLGSDNMNRTMSMPYSELIDKDRFEKFCSDTKKLSMSAADVHNLKEQMNIGEHDLTGLLLQFTSHSKINCKFIVFKYRIFCFFRSDKCSITDVELIYWSRMPLPTLINITLHRIYGRHEHLPEKEQHNIEDQGKNQERIYR